MTTATFTPLTADEMTAVRTYLNATAGMGECFSVHSAQTLREVEQDRGGPAAVADYTADLFKVLDNWHTALDQLHAGLALCSPSQMSLSDAAREYVAAEATEFVRSLNATRKAFCDWRFDCEGGTSGPSFRIDGAAITFSNFPPVTLSADIAAEAATD